MWDVFARERALLRVIFENVGVVNFEEGGDGAVSRDGYGGVDEESADGFAVRDRRENGAGASGGEESAGVGECVSLFVAFNVHMGGEPGYKSVGEFGVEFGLE